MGQLVSRAAEVHGHGAGRLPVVTRATDLDPTRPTEPVLVKARQVRRLLAVSEGGLRQLAHQGVLERVYLTPGGHPRYRLVDVLALVERLASVPDDQADTAAPGLDEGAPPS